MRDLFGYRWAFRCTTDSSSDVVLGQGWASEGYTAADIDPMARGVGWLLSETGIPRRIKAAYLTDDHINYLAAHAADLRRQGTRRMTAATAALVPDPHAGPGPGCDADDTEIISWADFTRLGTPARQLRRLHRTRSGYAAASTPSTWPPANSPPSTTPPPSPAECCTSPAATAARPSAPPARRSTSATPGSSSAPGSPAAKASPRPSPRHPCVFATLTAPSFGPVHARRMRGKTVLPCRPRRDAKARRCPHGRDISCPTRHVEDDPRLGQPMCGDCYDYTAAVLFNAYAGDLWRRFTTYLPRHLARRLGITQKRLRALVRVRYVKVAEYQARGVVHFHAVIRLDAPGDDYQPPPPGIDAAMLCDAIRPGRRRRPPSPGPDGTWHRHHPGASAHRRAPTCGPSAATT